jgi:nucleotide-binding universal stress UspA family protein
MYKRILVPVDGSPTAIRGLDEAIRLARRSGATIHLVHALDELVFYGLDAYQSDVFGALREAGARLMQQMQARVRAAGIEVTTFVSDVLPGRVCDVVIEQAKASGADLIVIGTHGRRGVGRMLMGSDAEQILRVAPTPVLLVRGADEGGRGVHQRLVVETPSSE